MCDLQAMVDICSDELTSIDMKLTIAKSQILRIWSRYCSSWKSIIVNGLAIYYLDKLKYLGCFLVAAKSFKFCLHKTRIKFYRAFNFRYSHRYKFCEPVLLHFCCTWPVPTVNRFSFMVWKLSLLPKVSWTPFSTHIDLQYVKFLKFHIMALLLFYNSWMTNI